MHVVDGGDREPIEQLEGDRREPGRGDPGHRIAGAVEGREEGEHRRSRRRRRAQPEGGLGDQAERPLAADDQVGQRVAGDVLEVAAAGPDDRAVGHHDLERQDRLAGLAVLHAAQAAGVGAQVPADRADLVAGRIRRVEQADLGDGGLERGVDDAGLDDRDEVVAIDLDDPVHRREGDGQRALDPGRAARQAGAGAARDDRDAQLGAIRTSSATCSVVVGRATAPGSPAGR